MTKTLWPVLMFLLAIPASVAWAQVEQPSSPFASIVMSGEIVVVQLAKGTSWTVSMNEQPARPAAPQEAFALRAADSLKLAERHLSFTFKPRLAGRPRGLTVWSVFDKRSFGGQVEHNFYFLPAFADE